MNIHKIQTRQVKVRPYESITSENPWTKLFKPVWMMESIFGVNRFLFDKNNIVTPRVRCCSLAYSVFVLMLVAFHSVYKGAIEEEPNPKLNVWNWLNDIQWITYVITVNVMKGNNNKFLDEIESILSGLKSTRDKTNYKSVAKAIALSIALAWIQLIIEFVLLFNIQRTTADFWKGFFFSISHSSNTFEKINKGLVYYAMKDTVTQLKQELKVIWKKHKNKIKVNAKPNNEASIDQDGCINNELIELYHVYENILNCSANLNVDRIFNFLFLLDLAASFIKGLLIADLLVSAVINGNIKLHVILTLWYLISVCVKSFILLLIPCVIVHIATEEEKKIKILLSKMLSASYSVDSSVKSGSRRDLKNFLSLMETRPLRYSIFRMITVDLSLPLAFLSLYTTYIIVTLQFRNI